jgi:hypothetical protein
MTCGLMSIACFDSLVNFVLMHRASCERWMNDPRANTGSKSENTLTLYARNDLDYCSIETNTTHP